MAQIQTYAWPNGFRAIYEKSHSLNNITYIQVFCDVGSAYETDDIRGASHMIEHMCFKGTHKIPTTKSLMVYYDKIGAYFNAYTQKRLTCYTLKCGDEYIEHSLSIMSDMIMNSKFDKKEFKKEQRVVIEENIRDSDSPLDLLVETMEYILYDGSSYMYPVDTLAYHKREMDYDKIVAFYNLFYQPSRLVISVVSNQPFAGIRRAIDRSCFAKSADRHPIPPQYFINNRIQPQYELNVFLKNKNDMNTTHVCIAFRVKTEDKYVLNMLQHILSSTFNSRLFMLLREQQGLTYTSRVFTSYNDYTGDFSIYTEADHTKILRNDDKGLGVFPILVKMCYDLVRNGVTAEEVRLAHGYLQGHLKLKIENNSNVANHNGYHFLVNPRVPVVPLSKIYEVRYQSIGKAAIDRVIRKYFKKSLITVGMIGRKLPSERQVKKLLEKFNDD